MTLDRIETVSSTSNAAKGTVVQIPQAAQKLSSSNTWSKGAGCMSCRDNVLELAKALFPNGHVYEELPHTLPEDTDASISQLGAPCATNRVLNIPGSEVPRMLFGLP